MNIKPSPKGRSTGEDEYLVNGVFTAIWTNIASYTAISRLGWRPWCLELGWASLFSFVLCGVIQKKKLYLLSFYARCLSIPSIDEGSHITGAILAAMCECGTQYRWVFNLVKMLPPWLLRIGEDRCSHQCASRHQLGVVLLQHRPWART